MNRTAKIQMEKLIKDVRVQPSGFIYIDIECNTEWSLSSDLCSRCADVMCNVHPLFHYLFTSHHSDQYCHTTLHKIYLRIYLRNMVDILIRCTGTFSGKSSVDIFIYNCMSMAFVCKFAPLPIVRSVRVVRLVVSGPPMRDVAASDQW